MEKCETEEKLDDAIEVRIEADDSLSQSPSLGNRRDFLTAIQVFLTTFVHVAPTGVAPGEQLHHSGKPPSLLRGRDHF